MNKAAAESLVCVRVDSVVINDGSQIGGTTHGVVVASVNPGLLDQQMGKQLPSCAQVVPNALQDSGAEETVTQETSRLGSMMDVVESADTSKG